MQVLSDVLLFYEPRLCCSDDPSHSKLETAFPILSLVFVEFRLLVNQFCREVTRFQVSERNATVAGLCVRNYRFATYCKKNLETWISHGTQGRSDKSRGENKISLQRVW